MKKVIRTAGLIFYRKEKDKTYYLLLQQANSNWNFSKGHVEGGEKELETATREAREETGITVSSIAKGFKEKINYLVDQEFKETVFYLAETKQKDVTLSSEHIAYDWFVFEKALSKLNFDNAKSLLEKAHKFLKTNE